MEFSVKQQFHVLFDMPYSIVQHILRRILNFYTYNTQAIQKLERHDPDTLKTFRLLSCRLNILWVDEAYFCLNGLVNSHNVASGRQKALNSCKPFKSLHDTKITIWWGFTVSFIIGPYICEEMTPQGLNTYSVIPQRYYNMLQSYVILILQQRGCLRETVFMQDGAPLNISIRGQ